MKGSPMRRIAIFVAMLLGIVGLADATPTIVQRTLVYFQTRSTPPSTAHTEWVKASDGKPYFHVDAGVDGGDLPMTGGGGGSVSLTCGAGLSCSPSTITGTGSIAASSGTSTLVRSGGPLDTQSVGGSGNVVYGVEFYVPSDVTQIRVHIANRYYGVSPIGSITTNVGICKSNGSLTCSGTETSWSSKTVPADGTDLVLPSTSTWATVSPGTDGKVVLFYSLSSGNISYVTFNNWGSYASGTTTVNPPPASWSASNTNPALEVHIEYNTAQPRVVVLGDSLSVGASTSGTAPGYISAWPQQLAHTQNWAVDTEGVTGITAEAYLATTTNPTLWYESVFTGTRACYWALGTNSLPAGVTIQATTTAAIALLHYRGCNKIVTYTVPPCSSYAANETTRQAYNGWLRTTSIPWLDHVDDVDAALDPTASGSLSTTACSGGTCAAADGCHWSTAGHAKVEALVVANGL